MLSKQSTSFHVSLKKIEIDNPYYQVGLHFLVPDLAAPLHCSNLVKPGTQLDLGSKAVFGLLTLKNNFDKKVKRLLFKPVFNVQQNHTIGAVHVSTFLHSNGWVVEHTAMPNMEVLNKYILNSLNMLKQTAAVDERLLQIHSVYWDFDFETLSKSTTVHVPYVCLVCRGDALVNRIKSSDIPTIQLFFTKQLMDISKRHSINPSTFIRMSQKALNDKGMQHAIYLHIATLFSEFVHKFINYLSDYSATGKDDSIGINEFADALYSDCEDMAQASYDLLRVFRRIFPSKRTDLRNGTTTFGYHISAWLNHARLGIMQGAVRTYPGTNQLGNHVWTVILPEESPAVFVEGTTGNFDPRLYQYGIRFWRRDSNYNLEDIFLVNKSTGKYGFPLSFLLSSENPQKLLEAWSNKTDTWQIKKELMFVANMQAETFNILKYMLNRKS